MWSRNQSDSFRDLTISESKLEANALVFPFRDLRTKVGLSSSAQWRGEIDVVAVMPGHAVIGFELKVLSRTAILSTQMDDQVVGLSILAEQYECPFLAQVALSPSYPKNLNGRINRLSFLQVSNALKELGACSASKSDILAIAAAQIDYVIDLLSRKKKGFDWDNITFEDLRQRGLHSPELQQWVGIIEGIDNLKLTSRTRWKVASEKLGSRWYPLSEVTRRIETAMELVVPRVD